MNDNVIRQSQLITTWGPGGDDRPAQVLGHRVGVAGLGHPAAREGERTPAGGEAPADSGHPDPRALHAASPRGERAARGAGGRADLPYLVHRQGRAALAAQRAVAPAPAGAVGPATQAQIRRRRQAQAGGAGALRLRLSEGPHRRSELAGLRAPGRQAVRTAAVAWRSEARAATSSTPMPCASAARSARSTKRQGPGPVRWGGAPASGPGSGSSRGRRARSLTACWCARPATPTSRRR